MAVTLNTPVPSTEPCSIVGLEWLAGGDKAHLSGALLCLPQQAQRILQLFYIEELKGSEVAFVLDLDILEVLKCHDAALSILRMAVH